MSGVLVGWEICIIDSRYTDKNGHNANLKKPDLSSIYFIVNEELSFSYFSNINLIKNKNILYVDTKSISKDNAFATIKTLAKELNFKEPNDNDEYKFTQKFWNELYYLLPYRLIVNNDILIIVSDENKVFLDNDKHYNEIKDDLIDIKKELVNTKSKLFDKISINIENKNWIIIKDDKALINDLREYIEKFMIILEKKANERLENMVKEEDVLNYLREHQDLGKKIKNILLKDNNPLDALDFSKLELYCKEIELKEDWCDKIKNFKTNKNKNNNNNFELINFLLLGFYRKLC
ncbi:DUF2972 domain-containing protein, partial [Campylobacter jejuni]